MSRSDPKVTSHPKHLYLVSPMVKHVLKYNFNRLHLINSGVRIFCRTNIPNTYHPYRCTNDGLDVLYRFVKNEKNGRCLPMSQADMITLLQSEYPKFADYSDELKQLHAQMDGKIGCIIAYLKEPIQIGEDKNFTCPLHLTAWRGQTKDKESLRAYIDKFDRRHYLHLLNAEVPESIDLNKSKHRKEYENGQVAEANVESASTLEEKAEPETETPVDPTPVEA